MAYDSARGVVVYFGGFDFYNPAVVPETWEWDGTVWTERNVDVPPAAYGVQAVAFDSARAVTVVVFMNQSNIAQTWEWDGTIWRQRAVGGPPTGWGQAMAYDSARGVMVLFGGQLVTGGYIDETWEWDGATWTQRQVSGPSSRVLHAMAYDSTRGVMVLFGGRNREFVPLDDTWEWDGTAWRERSETGPSPRSEVVMVFDSARGVSALFGGFRAEDFSYTTSETWEWSGSAWSRRSSHPPSDRSNHAMAYDAARGVTVLFGGQNPSGVAFYGDTWEWDGTFWSNPTIVGPSPRTQHAMAYDSARGVTVLFGGVVAGVGASNETWEWDGSVWARREVSGPPARYGHAMAYDSARGVTVLTGGYSTSPDSATWEWDGTTWVRRDVGGPLPRVFHSMAYDSSRGVTVLYGGLGEFNSGDSQAETWEWDGRGWAQRPSAPLRGFSPSMAYDSSRGVAVLVTSDLTFSDDVHTLEWNGSVWTLRSFASPLADNGHAAVFDSIRGVTVLFGGFRDVTFFDQSEGLWEYNAPCALSSITQPDSVVICQDEVATFAVEATGTGPLTYQWQWKYPTEEWIDLVPGVNVNEENDAPLIDVNGESTEILSVRPIAPYPFEEEEYLPQFRCVVTSDCGMAYSAAASMRSIWYGVYSCAPCEYNYNRDWSVDFLDAQQMAQVFVGLITREEGWLDGDLNGDENADLTDAQILAAYVVTGNCGV